MTADGLGAFACPRCRAPLAPADKTSVACLGEARHEFPLRDRAPLFLAASAERAASFEAMSAAYSAWITGAGPKWEAQRRRVWRAVVGTAVGAAPPPGLFADIGAGDGGLATLAARANYQAVAIDAALPPEGPFLRASASFDALPFADGAVKVGAYSASLHYADNLSAALREARRALRSDGVLLVALTPMNETAVGAQEGAATTQEDIRQAAGEGALSQDYRHLTRQELATALNEARFECEERPSGFSLAFRVGRAVKERLSGDEFARFPIFVCRPRD